MTEIEKQADKYFIKFWGKNNIGDILPVKTAWDLRCLLIDVIKYVLSEGRKDTVEWHDLRKDPNDLPCISDYVLCLDGKGNCNVACRTIGIDGEDYWHDIVYEYINPIAWCELPPFKDKE